MKLKMLLTASMLLTFGVASWATTYNACSTTMAALTDGQQGHKPPPPPHMPPPPPKH